MINLEGLHLAIVETTNGDYLCTAGKDGTVTIDALCFGKLQLASEADNLRPLFLAAPDLARALHVLLKCADLVELSTGVLPEEARAFYDSREEARTALRKAGLLEVPS